MSNMGWLWSDLNPFLSQEEKDRETAKEIMAGYFAVASSYPAFAYKGLSLEEYIAKVDADYPEFFRRLGEIVRINDTMWIDEDDAIEKVQRLARESQGKANPDQIIQWSVDPDKDQSWYDPITGVVSSVGEGLSSAGTVIKYLPYIAVVAGGLYLYFQAGAFKSALSRVKLNPKKRRRA